MIIKTVPVTPTLCAAYDIDTSWTVLFCCKEWKIEDGVSSERIPEEQLHEMCSWIVRNFGVENCKILQLGMFLFKSAETAIAFKLRWSDEV